MQLHTFESSAALNQQFASEISSRLAAAIAQKGAATLVVSGGKTPLPLFKTLSETDLDWSRVTITLADDRWLPETHADSNEGLVKANLLQGKAATASFISLFDSVSPDDAYKGAATVAQRIEALPQFDVLILGMGEDGHTASLFPCSTEIQAGLAADAPVALAVTPATAPYQRLSLSKTRLLNSAVIYLHLVGPKKLTVLEQAMAGQDPLQMPVRAFLQQQQVPVHVMFTAN
ncbi:MAG: 6-phosphogluconolactonase [Gammaproteobacteria bacterium]|nr:6-phosphogluconolactonase [Gammaproteobacteria bacterium]MBU2057844.1 6-phosphogluconolactonase [Gammaproteobacteria bacterium]MBU2176721.1 6-phosphogluconolactonase [Gammaproteobacteria bacterium]MBU2247854.1 6-phosphogluconolactonase [Gammaproteobacteria bacterium]MBU2346027.1 6-phosphogluconolactonase [Gammaproteobacteria bacterium]